MSRSYLFVPADSKRKIAKAADADADALILDLEDSVAPDARPAARELAADFVKDRDDAWVRINPIDTEDAYADLAAVVAAAPLGIILPKPRSADDVVALASQLDKLEAQHGIAAIGRDRRPRRGRLQRRVTFLKLADLAAQTLPVQDHAAIR